MKEITLAELPETVQNLIRQAQKTGEPLTIIQNGVPFAIISPIQKKSLLETLSTLEPLDEDLADVDERFIKVPIKATESQLTDEERLARLNQLFGAWENQPKLTEIFAEIEQQRHAYRGRNIDLLGNQDNG